MDTSNLFWFNNLDPDIKLTIENKYVKKLVKQMELEAHTNINSKILYDPIISKILHASTFYINKGMKNKLLHSVCENCSLTVDTKKLYDILFYVKLNLGIDTYAFVESKKSFSERKLSYHSYHIQRSYISLFLTKMHEEFINFQNSNYQD